MNDPISTHEMENLSAYLDGQLPDRERQRMEASLAQNAELRSELEDLRRLRSLLRAQPRQRAPRNFTLTPAMAGVRRGSRPAPTAYFSLRLASALATIFFVLVFAGDLIGRAVQPEPRRVQVANQEQPAMAMPVGGMGGGGGGGDGLAPAPPPAVAQEMPVEKSAAQTETLDSASANLAPEPTAQADLSAAAPLAALPEGSPMPPGSESETMTGPAFEVPRQPNEGGEPVAPPNQMQSNAPVEIARSQPVWSWSLLRFLQVFLALLAVVTGLAAFVLRRLARD